MSGSPGSPVPTMLAHWFDLFRYGMSVLFVITLPPAVAWWYLVHPFVGFWRRLGTKITLSVVGVFCVGSAVALFGYRDLLVGRDLGASLAASIAGVPVLAVAAAIAVQRRRHLTLRILTGVPEVADEGGPEALLDEGIYGRIRHPRYVEFAIGLVGWSLVLNYVGVYLMAVASIVAILLIVPLEERELRERFGEAYVEYSARVPRFIPRLR